MPKFKTHGKWILAGEHSVLRGCTALVFPVRSRCLDFEHVENADSLTVSIESGGSDLEMAFWGVLEKALQSIGKSRSDLKGHLHLQSNIPVGAGMGASATLCVSLARWFTHLGFIKEESQYEFSKSLEDLFHGQSSGVDVAVALNCKGLEFSKPNIMKTFESQWDPYLYLSYSGSRGVTSDCIQKVQALIRKNPKLGEEIDSDMARAVDMAKSSLLEVNSLDALKEAIDLARTCFERWGLVSQDLENHMAELQNLGAIATKPTGSGDGGFVISLWKEKPSLVNSSFELIEA